MTPLHSCTTLGGRGGETNLQNAKICYAFFWTRFCSSDRSQYSGSLLWDLGVTSPLIKDREWEGDIEHYRVMSGPQLAVCATGHNMKIYENSILLLSDVRKDQKGIPDLCIIVDIHT